MWRRTGLALALAVVAFVAAGLLLGASDAAGGTARSDITFGGWIPDGAARDTFWDMTWVDLPGVSLTAVHCHGRVTYDMQLGATGPSHLNPCYAALGEYSGQAQQIDTYLTLANGQAVYRVSTDYGPWRYCVGSLMGAEAPLVSGPPASPC